MWCVRQLWKSEQEFGRYFLKQHKSFKDKVFIIQIHHSKINFTQIAYGNRKIRSRGYAKTSLTPFLQKIVFLYHLTTSQPIRDHIIFTFLWHANEDQCFFHRNREEGAKKILEHAFHWSWHLFGFTRCNFEEVRQYYLPGSTSSTAEFWQFWWTYQLFWLLWTFHKFINSVRRINLDPKFWF